MSNHGIYERNGHWSKLEYPVNENSRSQAVSVIKGIYDAFLKDTDCSCYLSVISDKNRYLTVNSLYPSMDYEAYIDSVRNGLPFTDYIDISEKLSLEDFYKTDQHWRQERIEDIADLLLMEMRRETGFSYEVKEAEADFYGTFGIQSGMIVRPEKIRFLTNDILEACTVTGFSDGSGKPAVLYDSERAKGRDGYEMFLQGAQPLLVIDNPECKNGKELVLFRDSFGSSVAPLLVPAYSKVTLVDLRYMNKAILDRFVTFSDQDVLFLYSTLTLNSSISQ